MISIILVEPENSGNIGAVARVMANFNIKNLILLNPKCSHLGQEALKRAKHSKQILKKAKITKNLKGFDYLTATTALLGTDYNIPRSPITPEQLAEKLQNTNSKKIGLVFGRESSGLTNKEIQSCDFIVTIPTSTKYKTMNISHSVAIILYEIFKKSKEKKLGQNITPISQKEKQIILQTINKTLNKLPFATKQKKQTQKKLWKRIIGKAMLTKREAFALLGFLRKLNK